MVVIRDNGHRFERTESGTEECTACRVVRRWGDDMMLRRPDRNRMGRVIADKVSSLMPGFFTLEETPCRGSLEGLYTWLGVYDDDVKPGETP